MKKILLVFSTVLITVLSSLLLDYGAKKTTAIFVAVFFILLTLFVNFIKFLLWGKIHKKYDLSNSYPLTSMFFPLIYIIAIIKGQNDFELTKTIGIIFIVAGILFLGNIESSK